MMDAIFQTLYHVYIIAMVLTIVLFFYTWFRYSKSIYSGREYDVSDFISSLWIFTSMLSAVLGLIVQGWMWSQ